MIARLGVVLVPVFPPELLEPVAAAADEHLDELWLWEDCFKESGIASAAAALAWTSRVRVGIGLVPAPLRNVALLAMEVATLHRLFPGRLLPGVGHGIQSWMAQVGGRVDSPMTLLTEYAGALRRLLDGEEVTVEGRYVRLDRVRLDWPPPAGTPLGLGGFGDRTLELSGRLGDVLLLGSGLSEDEVGHAVTTARAGREAAGRGDEPLPVVAHLLVAPGPGGTERLDDVLRESGRAPAPGRGVAGDAEAVAAEVRRYVGLGATTVVLTPVVPTEQLVDFVRFAGVEVRAALSR